MKRCNGRSQRRTSRGVMKNSREHGDWISRARSWSVTVASALAIVLSSAVVGTPSAHAQTYTLLHSFQGPPNDGRSPQGGLIFDKFGNLYGTTWTGGSNNCGTVFALAPTGKEAVAYSFIGETAGDGAGPTGEIVRYAGNLYGTTYFGGVTGNGTVFELTGRQDTVVHSFTDVGGNFPSAGLARDASGNLYGTTLMGSVGTLPPACGTQGCGTVFEVSQGQETALYSFGGTPDGEVPSGNLILDTSGNLYGTTAGGGAYGQGTVFELSPNLDGTWTEHVLYSFTGDSDGANPGQGVVMGAKGRLFGTTLRGGHFTRSDRCRYGCGVVFKLAQNPDGAWTETVLHIFGRTAGDGQGPNGNLVRDKQGNLYGTTAVGGASGEGVVFEVGATGGEKVVHTFAGPPTDGTHPVSLAMDASGNLYGATTAGGDGCLAVYLDGCGTVFKITP